MMDFKPIKATGHIDHIEVIGVDAMGELFVVDIEFRRTSPDDETMRGIFTFSVGALKQFLLQADDALREAEARTRSSA